MVALPSRRDNITAIYLRHIPSNNQHLAMVPYGGAKELVYALLRLKGASRKLPYLIHRVQWLDEILIGHSSKQNKKRNGTTMLLWGL